jgi:hypothetical protein
MKDGKRMTKSGIGVDQRETRLLAAQIVIAKLRAESHCLTCRQEGAPPATEQDDRKWLHLYPDGSFLGPCFDPNSAKKLAVAEKEK